MAQTEDTELRDLVIEALEKNGSLAKIRALLRANIFLAFEDECVNMRQNVSLDNLLKVPEGILALSIVHEFLEACNLKNTLFVYKSESRQGKDYSYHGKKFISDRLNSEKLDSKEPILVSLLRNLSKSKYNNRQTDQQLTNKHGESGDNNYKDEQNNSYIVHDDSHSSGTNTSQSDHSSDEKNKLHLRLHLENSDTDTSTSTDSTRDKSSSEYIPSDHVLDVNKSGHSISPKTGEVNIPKQHDILPYLSKIVSNNSNDSTSYADLKPFSPSDKKALNTTGIPFNETEVPQLNQLTDLQIELAQDSAKSGGTLSSVSSLSQKNESTKNEFEKKTSHKQSKSDGETTDYTNEFSPSQNSKNKVTSEELHLSNNYDHHKSSRAASLHENSHSSISVSDVADLISEKSASYENSHYEKSINDKKSIISSHQSKRKSGSILNKHSDDSGDFSESPVPSLSNLSLDIHSD